MLARFWLPGRVLMVRVTHYGDFKGYRALGGRSGDWADDVMSSPFSYVTGEDLVEPSLEDLRRIVEEGAEAVASGDGVQGEEPRAAKRAKQADSTSG
jgi:hypothetical protein